MNDTFYVLGGLIPPIVVFALLFPLFKTELKLRRSGQIKNDIKSFGRLFLLMLGALYIIYGVVASLFL